MIVYYNPLNNWYKAFRWGDWVYHHDLTMCQEGYAQPSGCSWMVPGTVNPED